MRAEQKGGPTPLANTSQPIQAGADGPDLLDSREAGGRYIRGATMRMVAYGGGLLVGVVATPFVTRHLGAAGWGRFVTVTSLVFVVAALTEGGLANLGVRELSTADEWERRLYMSSLIGLRIVLSLVGIALAVSFAFVTGYSSLLVQGTAIAAVGLLLSNLQLTWALPLTAEMRLGWLAIGDFLAQAITAASMLALVALGASLLPFFLVADLTAAVMLVFTVVLVRKRTSLRPGFDMARWRTLLSESIVYAAATALGIVYFRVVVIAGGLLTSAKQTGYFGLGFRVVDIVNAVPWLLAGSAFPILARAARDDAHRLSYALQRMFEAGLIVGGAVALGLFVGAPFAVEIVGGPGFAPSVTVLRILAVGVPATYLVATWSFALLSLKRYRELIVVNAVMVLTAIALCVALIPPYASQGAALVTATLEMLLAAGYAIALVRHERDLRPSLQRIPRIALALAVALAASQLAPVPSVVAALVAVAVFAGLLATLGVLPEELIQAVFRRGATQAGEAVDQHAP
ncbi:MAG TPA: flippase [Solirubrobacteraceae bacterium]|jgi:O-antigen/teichoic acid export membrane protein|nr:flippase [Solirubrobacteraceae bacterium]